MQKLNYYDLINIVKNETSPFLRQNLIGKVKKNLGNGIFIWHDLGNGIASSSCNYKLNSDLNIVLSSKIAGAVLIFNLSEDTIYYTFKNKKKFELKKNSFIIGLSTDNFYVEMNLKKNTTYNTLTIGIKKALFFHLVSKMKDIEKKFKELKKNNYAIIDGDNIDLKQYENINFFQKETFNKNFLSNLYLESKTTDLIYYTINKIVEKTNNSKIDSNKIDSIKRAKEIILKEYSNSNLCIKDIAYKSATNECYLKKDFKAFYGMTLHKMLQKRRLEVAKEFLKENFSVKEVCLKVGYKHTGHFSKLFYNYFGITASEYKKEKNNY